MRKLVAPAIACLLATVSAQAAAMGSEAERAAGKQLYDKYCAQCHGIEGDGQGYATSRVKPEPRDFTSGKYKFRTTPSGMLPTDDDLRRVIRDGLPYTSMPGWPMFSDTEVQNIIYHLKTFSEDFQNPDRTVPPIDIPSPPPSDQASIDRGKLVFESQGCAACHGEQGRGNGASAPTLTDDWDQHIRAADMTMRWTFRGGATRRDIFRTFSTGVNGTPMPSYGETLEVADRWDLVNYIYSMGDGDEPDYSNLLLVPYLDDEIDTSPGSTTFDQAPVSRFPLVGQITQPGRNFYPSATSIQVQAVYNNKDIAFRLRWNDMRAETSGSNAPDLEVPPWDEDQGGGAGDGAEDDFWGEVVEEDSGDDFWGDEAAGDDDFWGEEEGGGTDDGGFTDAVALQFPSQLPTGVRKPYFLFGDTENPVDLWFADMARGDVVRQFVGRGSGSLTPSEIDELEVQSAYVDGEWIVTFKRPRRSTSTVTFAEDLYVPVAFSVWDGFNSERGNKRALSSWMYLYLEPSQEVSVVGPMVRAALIALVVELLVLFWLKRRFGRGVETATYPAGGGVPQGGMAR